jgi:hypothetical protein
VSRRARPVAAVLLTLAVSAVLACAFRAGPSAAQTTTTTGAGDPTEPAVRLVAQQPWVPLGGSFLMSLRIDRAVMSSSPEVALAIRVHERTTTRSAFDRAVDEGRLGDVQSQLTIPVSSIPIDARGNHLVRIGLSGSGLDPSVFVRQPGAYPMEVGLTNTDRSASFVSWLTTVDAQAEQPVDEKLQVAWLWQLGAPPTFMPDGSADETVVRQMQRGGRLDRITTLLDRAEDFPLTLLAVPETMESWARIAESAPNSASGLERARSAAARPTVELLPTSYVPIDLTILEAEGLGGELPGQFTAGADVLDRALGTRPVARTAFVFPANDAAVDRLRGMLQERVVLREESLVPVEPQFTPAQTFSLTTPQGVMPAAATAPFIEKLFAGDDDPAIKVQRVLAGLSEVAYEAPGIARGLVLATPADWDPDAEVVTRLTEALRAHPLLQPATLDDFFARVVAERRDGGVVTRALEPHVPERTLLTRPEYESAVDDLESYATIVGPADPSVVESEQALRVALSTVISAERAQAEVDKVTKTINDFTAGITVSSNRITLTSREAEMPLSFENSTGRESVRVRVRLSSPKLGFPEGSELTLDLPPGNTTVRVPVETRASGTFSMTIAVTSTDGRLEFGPPTRVTVRSAVFGGYAVALTVGAIAFLALWWGNHFWRTRRSRASAPTPVP